jgi:hypothetical protein
MSATDTPRMRLLDWKPLSAGALLGRASVELNGLVISDVGIFAKDGARWSQMPAEPMRDRDGQLLKGENGKVRYRSPLKWKTRELQERFSHALISAIEAQHGALGGDT